MAEQKAPQNGADEQLDKSAKAASAIQGAVKTGKAIAQMAKGAAAGGPFGAAAGALWANRKLVGKILAAACLLLMLPILFLCMLPSLVFGDLTASPETPVLNDATAVSSNLELAEEAIRSALTDAHDVLLEEIRMDFEDVSGVAEDTECRMELEDPFEEEILFDSVLLVSQYCASKGDYTEISVNDLSQIVRAHASSLFSYESQSHSGTDEEGVTTVTVTYTVDYAGDSYFADGIFALNPEQKELAENYASNLNLFLDSGSHAEKNNTHNTIQNLLPEYPFDGPAGAWGSPFPGSDWRSHVTSPFGDRIDPITHKKSTHSGVDIAYPKGTPIHTVRDGVVVVADASNRTSGYGFHIAIHHGDGTVTLYAHCDQLLVRPGQTVQRGDIIAKVGATGRVTGPHLHIEVLKDGEPQNPMNHLKNN